MTNTQKNKIYKLAYEKEKQDRKEEIVRHILLLSVGIMFLLMLQIADLKSLTAQIICYILVILAMLCSVWSIYRNHKYIKTFANDINDRLFNIVVNSQDDYELKIDDYTVTTILKEEFNAADNN